MGIDHDSVVLYGTGKWGEIIFKLLADNNFQIDLVVDSDERKCGKVWNGYVISSRDVIFDRKDRIIIVAIQDGGYAVIQQLIDWGVPSTRIWSISNALRNLCVVDNNCIHGEFKGRTPSILFDCPAGLDIGGIEEWTKKTLMDLSNKEAYILTPSGDYVLDETIKQRVIFYDAMNWEYSKNRLREIFDIMKAKRPCVVVAAEQSAFFWAAVSLKCQYPDQVKIVSVIHNTNDTLYKKNEECEDLIDYYVTTSAEMNQRLCQTKIPAEKIRNIYIPIREIDITDRKYAQELLQPIRIGFVGRLVYRYKRIDLMIKLIEELEKRGVFYTMEIVGKGECEKDLTDFLINRESIKPKVILRGALEHEKVFDFWKQIDVAVNISDYEGICISNSEAMACGAVPVITDTSAREYIVNGENGYIVPVGDYKEMARKIEDLSHDRERLSRMGKRASLAIRSRCSEEGAKAFWDSFFDEVMCELQR